MRCPARKRALKEKEELMRKGDSEPTPSFARATTQQQQTPTPPPYDPGLQLKGYMCLLQAHLVNSVAPGTFQDTLSDSLRLNGLPDVKLPQNPPSLAIVTALGNAGVALQANRNEQPPPPPPPVAPAPVLAPPATPPPTRTPEAPTTPEAPSAPGKKNPADNAEHTDEEEVTVFLVKDTQDVWPENITYASIKKGVKNSRYKIGHDGDEKDTEEVLSFLKTKKGSLDEFCNSAPTELFKKLTNGPYNPEAIRNLLPSYKRRRNPKWRN